MFLLYNNKSGEIVDSIKVKNLTFSYSDNIIFDNISFNMPLASCSIIGPSESGKTTLLRLLSGREIGKGSILINSIDLNDNNFKLLRRYLAVVFKDSPFVKERVIDELRFPLENQGIKPQDISNQVNDLLDYFDLSDLSYNSVDCLTFSEKIKIRILSYLIMNPKYIALDDLLIETDSFFVNQLLKYIKEKEIYLINVTTNMEELLYTDYVLCLYDKKIGFEGEIKQIIKEEKLFKRMGMSLPFIVDLSIQLKYYGLINEIYFNQNDLLEAIWK